MKNDNAISDKVKNIRPYKWEGSATKNLLRFDSNTLPSPPPSVSVFLADMKIFCPVNEYTDPGYRDLKSALSRYENVPAPMITVTNSGDEAIDILAKTFLNPGDKFITVPPTYEMYGILGTINNGVNLEIPPDSSFRVNTEKILSSSNDPRTKVIFIANPNNPTGTVIPPYILETIIKKSGCIVVVDEAYGEFYGTSAIPLIQKYRNLVVLKSFSKFAGLAGARIGYLIANRALSRLFNSVRFPMGVSYLSAKLAQTVLENDREWISDQIREIKTERIRVSQELTDMGCFVYPSLANFLLVRFGNRAEAICGRLKENGILVRKKYSDQELPGCVRITIRNSVQNNQLISALKEIL